MLSVTRYLPSGVFAAERERYVLWVPVFLGTGIGVYFLWPSEPLWWIAALLLAAGMGATWMLRRHFFLRLLTGGLAVALLGFTLAALRTQSVGAPALYSQLFYRTLTGRIDDIQLREEGEKLYLSDISIERVSPRTGPVRVSVTLRRAMPELRVGDRIETRAMLFPPPTPAMPGANDFARQFYYDRLGGVGYAPNAPVVLAHGETRGVEEWLGDLRLSFSERIVRSMQAQNGPVAAALMVGEMSQVSQEVRDAMRDAGIYHVLSISGLHMSLAVGLLYFSVRFLLSLYPPLALRLPVKKIAAVVGLVGALAYLLLAGYPVPAVRSFVMVACVMLAVLFDRRGISLYSLAWAATLILLFQPEALLGASFQLSFAATLGILALYETHGHRLRKPGGGVLRTLWLYFTGLMATSLVATVMTTPLVITQFNRFTLWGVAANMLVVPLASFWIMPAAVLAFLAMPLGLEYWPLQWLDRGIGLMIDGARWFAGLPHAAFSLPSLTFPGLLLVVFGGLWLCLWRRGWRLLGVPAMALGLASIALHRPYDLLVSDDGTRIAVRREDGEFLFIRGKPDSYDAQTWLRSHGKDSGLTLADVRDSAFAPVCDKIRCDITLHGRHIAIGRKRGAAEGLCDGHPDIVISEDTLVSEACKDVPLRLDRRFFRANGATGLRFSKAGTDVTTAAGDRGDRPWNTQVHYRLYQAANPDIVAADSTKETP